MIITQIYEYRHWTFPTSVHKIAFWLQFTQADQPHDCIGSGPFHHVVHVQDIPRNATKTSGSLSFERSNFSSVTESQFSNAVPLCFFWPSVTLLGTCLTVRTAHYAHDGQQNGFSMDGGDPRELSNQQLEALPFIAVQVWFVISSSSRPTISRNEHDAIPYLPHESFVLPH